MGGYRRHKNKFYLTFDESKELFFSNCFYCGAPPSNRHPYSNTKKLVTLYSGIDRIDNSKPYTIDNVVACCGYCNKAKNNQTLEEFLHWVNALEASCRKAGLINNSTSSQ